MVSVASIGSVAVGTVVSVASIGSVAVSLVTISQRPQPLNISMSESLSENE